MMRVLAIEDDETTAKEIVAELSAHGFSVEWAADGREGLMRAASGGYDAITLDRMLPGLDGLAIVGLLRGAGGGDAGPDDQRPQRCGRAGEGPSRRRRRLSDQALSPRRR